ncbi:Piso0_003829 [Millerozyma farinosa CBS 7064]|uniref:Nuclear mRNA export factor n=1 Tax=Pichia sorbitophila (strain ATCC MYA-4447 / BCRC 22081 / CBS 7064 / NBRC 10061 / NRRL Y-12695) TaxID=559304 RepID=G8Y6Q8_PICSO|nr:Piso0_003829 [Millerozyma farinosa CBS 7064]CCE84288.1 Piso0_003829 [Millerozyma farinosa CBS 7064]
MSALEPRSSSTSSSFIPSKHGQKPSNGYGDGRRNNQSQRKRLNRNNNIESKNNTSTSGNPKSNGTSFEKRKGNVPNRKQNRPNKHSANPSNSTAFSFEQSKSSTPTDLPSFSLEEVSMTGPLIADPESHGFRRKSNIPARPTPRYLIRQPRILVTPVFDQNIWDKDNQEKMLEMEAKNSGKDFQGLYEDFQKMRENERNKMISLGLVDAENTRKDLNDAISFQGTCVDMCPIFERVRRALENNVKALEKDPVTNKISRDRAVKAFSRPAAGQPPPLPSDVRPPRVLKNTLDYLVDSIVPQLPEAHSFLWDRTRSIRQDFIYQNFYGPEAIDCNERIVRIHLVSLHIMAGSDLEYSQQQELEQFNKALQTLMEIYADVRNHGGSCPNEAEFRAYYLLSHIRDPEPERELQTLPDYILKDKQIQLALKIRTLVSQNNIVERNHRNTVGALNLFSKFFEIVYSEETPFLISCLLETQFNEIRFYALKSMSRCYHTKGRAYPADILQKTLGFDSLEKLVAFVEYYEIDTVRDEENKILIDLFNKEKLESKYKLNSFHDKPKLTKTYSTQLDDKIQGLDVRSFINSGKPVNNLNLRNAGSSMIVPTNKSGFNSTSKNSIPAVPADERKFSFNFSGTSRTPSASSATFDNVQGKSQTPFTSALSQPANQVIPPSLQNNTSINQGPSNNFKPKEQPSVSTFNFGPKPDINPISALPTRESGDQKTEKNKPAVFTFGKPSDISQSSASNNHKLLAGDTSSSNLTSLPSLPSTRNDKPQVEAPRVIEVPKPKKLKDEPLFSTALDSVYKQILSYQVNKELGKLLQNVLDYQASNVRRRDVIRKIGTEVFSDLLSNVIFDTTSSTYAESFYERNLKLRMIKRIGKRGKSLLSNYRKKREKINELHSISFQRPVHKRSSSNASSSFVNSNVNRKRLKWDSEESMEYISKKQMEIRKLWEPLNLKVFLDRCSKNFSIPIESDIIKLKFLVVVENWSFSCSKWLHAKLALKPSDDKSVYCNSVKNDKLEILTTSLPNNDLSKTFFSETAFMVFECGFLNEIQLSKFSSLDSKLKRDGLVLRKLIAILNKHALFKVQILVLYWNVSSQKLDSGSLEESLDVSGVVKQPSVRNLSLLDMSSSDNDINSLLTEGFYGLADTFSGELTRKGLTRKARIFGTDKKPDADIAIATSTPTATEQLPSEPSRPKSRQFSKKYEYLKNHLRPNTSFAQNHNISNRSLALHNRHLQNSFLNTTMNNSNISGMFNVSSNSVGTVLNDSLLAGLGTGVIEESTPFASPKTTKFAKSAPQTAPNNGLQQLRQLVADVRTRYKREQG